MPTIAITLVLVGAVISWLKGHRWQGLLGAIGSGIGVMWMVFASLDVRPLDDVEESVANGISLASTIATLGGIALLLLGAVRSARPGSWWEVRRAAGPAAG